MKTATRKPLIALTLSWRLALLINGRAYAVEPLRDAGRLYAYRLTQTEGMSYQVSADCRTCDCPDAVFAAGRPGGCKHARALREALAALCPVAS